MGQHKRLNDRAQFWERVFCAAVPHAVSIFDDSDEAVQAASRFADDALKERNKKMDAAEALGRWANSLNSPQPETDASQYTKEEIIEKVLQHVAGMANYWATLPDKTPLERCGGLAFSILVMLDGASAELPSFVVAPSPHPDDKQYHIDHGERYYPEGPEVNCDIAGYLHELFHNYAAAENKNKRMSPPGCGLRFG